MKEDYEGNNLGEKPRKRSRDPEEVVAEVADLMWSLGIFQIGASLFAALVAASAAVDHVVKGFAMRSEQVATATGILALSIIGTLIGGYVVKGASAMKRLQGYSKSKVAAFLTLLSLPYLVTAPFSVPVGIWALAILRRTDVRERFELSDQID